MLNNNVLVHFSPWYYFQIHTHFRHILISGVYDYDREYLLKVI